MNLKVITITVSAAALSACTTYTTPRYAISADNNVALKRLDSAAISVGAFSGPAKFDPMCRASGPLAAPDGMSYSDYIRKAFEDELKVAGIYATEKPRISITGTVKKLDFFSFRGVTGGTWDIEILLKSSNGKTMPVNERYEFESGYVYSVACKQTAEAFFPAVQNLIGKAVRSPEFKTLIQ